MSIHKALLFIVGLALFSLGCGNKATGEPILLDALKVQNEGIILGMRADSIIKVKLNTDTFTEDVVRFTALKQELADWKANRIGVPGYEHDYHGHDHDHDHDHSNDHKSSVSHLKPEQILEVQKEWKAVVENIYNQVK